MDFKRNAYTILKKCKKCKQYWQIDADYRTSGLAIKIKDPVQWSLLSDFQIRKEAIIQHHGGESNEICKWKHCDNNAMFNLVFCVECAYTHMKIFE